MIKMLHFADIHIGMENFGKTDPVTGLSSRVMDFVHRLDEIVAYALERDVDLVVFAGDAFKTRNPNPTFQREFAFRILDLAEKCPVVLLVGNHDLPTNMKRASSIELYDTLRVPNVYVGDDYRVRTISTKSGDVEIATAPYPVRARLLEDEREAVSISKLDEKLQDTLYQILQELASEARQSDAPRVLAGHFTIAGAVLGSERQVMLGRDVAALLSSVADPAWDYVAMGHIHKFQDLTHGKDHLPPVVYSGSVERIDFGEEGDPKGFCWVELERGNTSYEFIPLDNVRPFVTLRVDVRRSTDPTKIVLAEIERHNLTNAIVRVMVTSDPESDSLLKPKVIEDAVMGHDANMVAGLYRQVERPERTRFGSHPEGLTPIELLERYLVHRDLEEDQVNTLLDAAKEIFAAAEEQ